MTEKVNHPAHYGGADNPFEVIKVLEAWLTPEEFVGFCRGNSIKYNARARSKGGAEDVAKASWYDTRLVDFCRSHPDVLSKVTGAVARQLQQSMERNARMSNRLKRVEKLLSGIDGELLTHTSEIDTALNRILWGNRAIESILKDEEPTWPTK